MFYGTKLFYKVLYYVTAMAPAYFLFLLQINDKFNKAFDTNIYVMCLILFILIISLAYLLKNSLYRHYIKERGNEVPTSEIQQYSQSNLEESNGSVISFLLGNIIPGVLIMENSIYEAIIVFLTLQILIFILIMKSSDIFPNILLVILGVDLCKTKEGKYLFVFKKETVSELKVFQIGDSSKSKTFITIYKK
ncbi:hypothetical protein JCM9140_2275 [Halalkalibacter wakoensis JCM 9140]|uniref:Uncharacterized protein n=1 Tax=Halalkalibacter wakoensis JCM 9140 TaxID=1236970 RepID=W4Q2C8_9BACI|nr:hypothetical protein [Halalkalibacter wakoensis]GAE26236.1 hypothetical protein JCM9140_2275 [Halalkalibacter wakoensis JCM 9140]